MLYFWDEETRTVIARTRAEVAARDPRDLNDLDERHYKGWTTKQGLLNALRLTCNRELAELQEVIVDSQRRSEEVREILANVAAEEKGA